MAHVRAKEGDASLGILKLVTGLIDEIDKLMQLQVDGLRRHVNLSRQRTVPDKMDQQSELRQEQESKAYT